MNYCPFCGKENLIMKKVKRNGISYKDKKVVKGLFDVWTCMDCKESFFYNLSLTKYNKTL